MAVKGKVADTLKTASLFLLCAHLIERGARSRIDLYRQIALFPFNDSGIVVDFFTHKIDRLGRAQRQHKSKSHAVVILQKIGGVIMNSAKRVSEPMLANIQCACYEAAKLDGVLLNAQPR